MFPIDLSQRTAVITGGASGIGRAIALAFAKHGANVWTGDLRPAAENEPAFSSAGISQIHCDVRREADVRSLIEAATAATGRLDIVVHSAGIVLVRQIPDVLEEEWDACLEINLKGAFLLAKHAIGPMQKSGGGSIILIASNSGLLPRAHDPVYSTSKAAVIAFGKSLALCHSVDKIRVNSICPGPVAQTEIIDRALAAADDGGALARHMIDATPIGRALGRMNTLEEIAQAALYLASDASVMVTGTSLRIDGGKSLGVPPPRR